MYRYVRKVEGLVVLSHVVTYNAMRDHATYPSTFLTCMYVHSTPVFIYYLSHIMVFVSIDIVVC